LRNEGRHDSKKDKTRRFEGEIWVSSFRKTEPSIVKPLREEGDGHSTEGRKDKLYPSNGREKARKTLTSSLHQSISKLTLMMMGNK
jgi:hypothetical protein